MIHDKIVITNSKDGTKKTINLNPVDKFMSILEQSCKGRYPLMNESKTAELLNLAMSLNKDQLVFLVNRLTSEVKESARTIRYMHTKAGIDTTKKLRDLVKNSDNEGLPLWEDYNELRE